MHRKRTIKKRVDLWSQRSQIANFPSRRIDDDFKMKVTLSTTCSVPEIASKDPTLRPLEVCKNFTVTLCINETKFYLCLFLWALNMVYYTVGRTQTVRV